MILKYFIIFSFSFHYYSAGAIIRWQKNMLSYSSRLLFLRMTSLSHTYYNNAVPYIHIQQTAEGEKEKCKHVTSHYAHTILHFQKISTIVCFWCRQVLFLYIQSTLIISIIYFIIICICTHRIKQSKISNFIVSTVIIIFTHNKKRFQSTAITIL